MSPVAHRVLRAALLLVVAGGIGLALHRLRRSDDQVELTSYVEKDLPPLVAEERAVADGVAALFADTRLPAKAARARIVDDLNPRLARLRHRAEALHPTTRTVRTLAARYLGVVDGWSEATRAAVRVIDDPKVSTEAALVTVREKLDEAARTSRAYGEEVVATCRLHRLTATR